MCGRLVRTATRSFELSPGCTHCRSAGICTTLLLSGEWVDPTKYCLAMHWNCHWLALKQKVQTCVFQFIITNNPCNNTYLLLLHVNPLAHGLILARPLFQSQNNGLYFPSCEEPYKTIKLCQIFGIKNFHPLFLWTTDKKKSVIISGIFFSVAWSIWASLLLVSNHA